MCTDATSSSDGAELTVAVRAALEQGILADDLALAVAAALRGRNGTDAGLLLAEHGTALLEALLRGPAPARQIAAVVIGVAELSALRLPAGEAAAQWRPRRDSAMPATVRLPRLVDVPEHPLAQQLAGVLATVDAAGRTGPLDEALAQLAELLGAARALLSADRGRDVGLDRAERALAAACPHR